jgi:hypothetical protein
MLLSLISLHGCININSITGADPGFQIRGGAQLKKLCRAKGGAKIFGVFRVKNHDFMPKNQFFSNIRGGACWVRLPLDPPLHKVNDKKKCQTQIHVKEKASNAKIFKNVNRLIHIFVDRFFFAISVSMDIQCRTT